jgi:hypothetical protein
MSKELYDTESQEIDLSFGQEHDVESYRWSNLLAHSLINGQWTQAKGMLWMMPKEAFLECLQLSSQAPDSLAKKVIQPAFEEIFQKRFDKEPLPSKVGA